MVGFAIAALALVLTAGFATAALRLRSSISFVLGVYVLASVEIVVLAEILSFFDAVGATGFALGQAVLGALAVAAWAATGRPRPPIPSVSGTSLRRHPLLTALVVLVVASTAFQAFLVVSTPPNNGDSMTYHLTRTAAWLERGAVERFPTYDEVQNAYPPNAEIEVLFTFAYADGDTVAAFVQLVAKLVLLVAVYGLARRVRFERPAALFAAVVFGCLTLVVVQSVTTQNHLVVAAQVAAAAYFGLELARGDPRAAILAGLAVGLAVGTKWTGLAALPGLGLLWVVATRDAARLVRLVAWSAVGLVLVGVYGYALNAADTGHLLGDTSGLPIQSRPSPGEFVESLVKLTLDFGDFSGYFRNANEDSSYFGTLGWLLVLPLSAGFTIAWALRRTSAVRGALAVNLPLFMIILAASHPYERFDGRLLILPVALVAPLAAWVYDRTPATEVVAALAVVTLVLATIFNPAKPVGVHGTPVWELDRTSAQSLRLPEMDEAVSTVDEVVPADAPIGAAFTDTGWSYPLYGERLDRRVVYLEPGDVLAQADRLGLDYVVADRGASLRDEPDWCVRTFPLSGWRLAHRCASSAPP